MHGREEARRPFTWFHADAMSQFAAIHCVAFSTRSGRYLPFEIAIAAPL